MTLKEAYSKAKKLNRENTATVCKIVYKNYGGYGIECEPFELPMLRATLNTISSNRRGFLKNYRLKYAR